MKWFNALKEGAFTALFPGRCAGCGEVIDPKEYFCDFCYEMLSKTAKDKSCAVCGCQKKNCQCKQQVFHFSRTTAPFYYEGPARKAMYSFKFRNKKYLGNYFAQQMALKVKNEYYGIEFDAVTFVPMQKRREMRRGYNQSEVLAEGVAKYLELPVIYNALKCNNKKKIQHETKFEERFKNVRGTYFPNMSLEGKRILLIDDIKTSGATLDECAKTLFKAGASEVYCVTALITQLKRKKEEK